MRYPDSLGCFSINQRGLIPGPTEPPERFWKRVEAAKSLGIALNEQITQKLGAIPDWVPIEHSSKGLAFWEGAATWIEEEEGMRSCRIQLRSRLPAWLYSSEEIIAHELVHAIRIHFDEPQFEEALAYRTSPNPFRRYFGPLFAQSKWVKALLLFSFLPWVLVCLGLEAGTFLFVPVAFLLVLLLRLMRIQKTLNRALNRLGANALQIVLRLTDKEIREIANFKGDIREFALEKSQSDLRWRMIWEAYFSPTSCASEPERS